MPRFIYKVRDKEGRAHTGTMEGTKQEAVVDQLNAMGYIPIQVKENVESQSLGPGFFRLFNRVTSQDLIFFSRQLATLMSAGVPFIQSMTIVEKQTSNLAFQQTIAEIRRDVESGVTFSDALEKHPKIFSKLYVSMIMAAETAGIMDSILNRLALLAEHEMETRSRIKTAVRYPLIVVVAICAAFAFLVSFVIPKFASIFAQFKTELPLPTRVLIGINYAVQHYWFLMVPAVALFVWGVIRYVRTPAGKWKWDGIKLRLPIFGPLFQKTALSRFARVFGAMQKSGLAMILTLDIVSETVGNVVLARGIEEIREGVREGKGLAGPMEAAGLFPPLVVQMVAVGEETGELEPLLNRVSDYYDMEVEYTLRNLSTMIEPILLLFVGGMVLFLALGIFLPMWNMISLFRH
jgi:type II secretory pathway component PulF